MQFYIPKSDIIKGIQWTSERLGYPEPDVKGDTYPMTWGPDGDIYTSSGDPCWGESMSGLDFERFVGGPTDYKIIKQNEMHDFVGWGGNGPKPTGMICVDGMLYLAVQNLRRMQRPPFGINCQHGSDAHIIHASTVWKNWSPAFANIDKQLMFPGSAFGGPAFVNFGQNNADARDGYVYACSADQWDNGSNLRLGRVPKDRVMDRSVWEFVCAYNPDGTPAWSNNLDLSIPVLSVHRHISTPELVYLKSINRYLLFTWRLHEDFMPNGTDLFIYEAPEPWGPFSLAHAELDWEGAEQDPRFGPYCPRLPLKWIESDGQTCWLQFSGSWGEAGQSKNYYRSSVRQFKLLMK